MRNKFLRLIKNPKVSIIIPLYNSEEYIKECLESIVNQTYNNFEVIIVDDGSTDNSVNIVETFRKKLEINLIKQTNSGASSARNNALNHVRGKYIVFIDSDDILAPTGLENLYTTITKYNSDMVIGRRGTIFEDTLNKSNRFPKLYKQNVYNQSVAQNTSLLDIIGVPSKIYATKFIQKNKLRFVEGITSEDFIFSYQVALVTKKISTYVDNEVYYYRTRSVGEKSITQSRLSQHNLESRFIQMQTTYEIAMSDAGKKVFKFNEAKRNYQIRLFRHLCSLELDNQESTTAFALIHAHVKENIDIIIPACNKNYRQVYRAIERNSLEDTVSAVACILRLKEIDKEISRLTKEIKTVEKELLNLK